MRSGTHLFSALTPSRSTPARSRGRLRCVATSPFSSGPSSVGRAPVPHFGLCGRIPLLLCPLAARCVLKTALGHRVVSKTTPSCKRRGPISHDHLRCVARLLLYSSLAPAIFLLKTALLSKVLFPAPRSSLSSAVSLGCPRTCSCGGHCVNRVRHRAANHSRCYARPCELRCECCGHGVDRALMLA